MNKELSHYLKIRQIITYIIRAAKKYLSINKTVYVQQRIDEYKQYWKEAADKLSLDFRPLTDDVWEIGGNMGMVRVANFKVPVNDPVTFHICADKLLSYRFAMELGIPVPHHSVFHLNQLHEAKLCIKDRNKTFVIKPAYGTGSGQGVTTHVRTLGQFVDAFILASTYCNKILVEEMVPAESCKLLFLGGQMIHASRRRGVRLTGDGVSSLAQLAAREKGGVPFDQNFLMMMDSQNLTRETVLPKGQEVVIRSLPQKESNHLELRTIYDETITDAVCRELVNECNEIVKAVGCDLASVDILTNDPGKPLSASGGVFNEINADPGIHHHYNTAEDHEHGVAEIILKHLLHLG